MYKCARPPPQTKQQQRHALLLPTILRHALPLRIVAFRAPSTSRSLSRLAAPLLHPPTTVSPRTPPPRLRALSCSIRMSNDDNSRKDGSAKWSNSDGHFRRQESSFRSSIEKGGKHEPERGRYHLIVALACPWAHRALIVRQLKGIDQVPDLLPVHVVDSLLGSEGWSFVPYDDPPNLGVPGTGNHIPGHEDKKRIRDIYKVADPEYSQRCTVPVVWDAKLNTIVNNESSEVIRNLNTAFDEFIPEKFRGLTFYPEQSQKEIDAFHEWVYPNINNGVYKCGFATTQQAYESNVGPLFDSLDRVEKMLEDGRQFLYADTLTEADIRLYTTIVRFDPVYFTHFKCNLRTIRDGYPRINSWMQNLYWNIPAFKHTTDFDSIKAHYFQSHTNINPNRIVPTGPFPHILPLN